MSRSSETMPAPLSIRTGGRISSTLRPQWVVKPAFSAASATSRTAFSASSSSGTPRQCSAAIASLSSRRTRSSRSFSPNASWAKSWTRRVHACSSRSISGWMEPGLEHLRAVRAEVGDRPQRDDPPRVRGPAPADAGDDAVALGHVDQRPPRRLGHVRVVRMLHDRRQHAVHVEQHRRAPRLRLERPQEFLQGGGRLRHVPSMPSMQPVTATERGEGWSVGSVDGLGDGPGFRKIRSELGVQAFGVNAVVLPPGYAVRQSLPRAPGGAVHRPAGRDRVPARRRFAHARPRRAGARGPADGPRVPQRVGHAKRPCTCASAASVATWAATGCCRRARPGVRPAALLRSRSRISVSSTTSSAGASEAGSSSRLARAITVFIGLTTRKKTTAATIRNAITALKNTP